MTRAVFRLLICDYLTQSCKKTELNLIFFSIHTVQPSYSRFHYSPGMYILAISPPPPWKGGERGTFWSLGKKIGPFPGNLYSCF